SGPRGLARGHRCPPGCPKKSSVLFDSLLRRKEIGVIVAVKEGSQYRLSTRTEIDEPRASVMLGFVPRWHVEPRHVTPVDVARPHARPLVGPHAGQTLKLNHRRNLPGSNPEHRFNSVVRNWPDWLRLTSFGAATP